MSGARAGTSGIQSQSGRSAGSPATHGSASAPGAGPAEPLSLPAVDAFLQRAVACSAPPVSPQPVAPEDDPRFTTVTDQIGDVSAKQRAHAPPRSKVAEAQGAAVPPSNEVAAQARAGQVDKMSSARPGDFDKAAFIAAVGKAINAVAPKNLEEADDLKDSGKSSEVKQQVVGIVTKGKENSAKDIRDATNGPLDSLSAQPKTVVPMSPEQAGSPPSRVAGDQAMPAPRGTEQTNLDHGPCSVNDKLADAKVTDEQLKKGNEPRFDKALQSKLKVEEHAATAPEEANATEAAQRSEAQVGSVGTVASGLAAMHGDRSGAIAAVGTHKDQTKAADETKRAEVSKHIEDVFSKTKTDVNGILDGLDKQVSDGFDAGEKDARQAFDAGVGRDMDAWKDERYSGITGAARWLADKFTGAPPEVNDIFARNRAAYLAKMDKVISDIGDLVGRELERAKHRIADGRAEVKQYMDSQPAALKQFASDAAEKISDQFDSLDSDVNSKQQSVVSDLAEKYVAARQAVDNSIKQMQAENEGLVQEAEEAVEGAIDIVLKMKDMLLNVLSRVANAIERIIEDPIAFLGNLVNAVKAGLTKFVDNIWEHLKKGLLNWLLGALRDSGTELPEKFDLKGILNLVLSILGLTWTNIRSGLVAHVGEPAMAAIEKTVDVFKVIGTEGLAGLWNWIVDRIGDFKETVISGIRSFVVEKVIKAGVEWLIGVLNPAAAFIKACEAIYNVVMFFVEKGQAIIEFVNSILDSVESILNGGVGQVADLIEGTLAKMIPLIISFLADLLGLGGISDKIKEIIAKIQAPVNKAIDRIIGGALKVGKKMFGGLVAKAKGAKQWAEGKIEAGKAAVTGAAKGVAVKVKGAFSVHESFSVDGEEHTLSSVGETKQLVVASDNPTVLDSHPDRAVNAAYAAFLRLSDDSSLSARKRAIAAIVVTLRGWLSKRKGKSSKAPGRPAPGIGHIAPHRSQVSSLRSSGIPVWFMEAEHVVPRAMTNNAFTILQQAGIAMGSPDYEAQHTVMLYKGASNLKTRGPSADNARSRELKEKARLLLIKALRKDPSERLSYVKDHLFSGVMDLVSQYGADAADRTMTAIAIENSEHRAERGPEGSPESPSPDAGQVSAAATKQVQDILDQFTSRMQFDGPDARDRPGA